MSTASIYDELDTRAAAVANQVVKWRHHLHRHPELSNREGATATLIAEHLRALKLDEVRTGIAGHGVVGVLHGGLRGDRVIALRADTDALPVQDLSGVDFASHVIDNNYPGGPFPVSHACGHDCHTAMLMGAATVLADIRDKLSGTMLFVFQPAEEGPPPDERGGAREMLAEGALDNPPPTMAFGFHVAPYPKGYIGYRAGNLFAASCLVKITINGQQVHGSMPWAGIDPMPAAGAILTGIGQIYRQVSAFDPITVTIGHIEDVGRFNIIGRHATLWGTIRCTVESDMGDVQQRVRTLAEQTSKAYNCSATVEFLQDVPAVHNTQEWVTAGLPTMRRVAGDNKVIETFPGLGYDDVSEFVNKYGGLYVLLGVQDTELSPGQQIPVPTPGGRGMYVNHNPHFYADDDTLVTGVRLHCHAAHDHLAGDLEPR
ncbi:MAG: amidohydrolase [Nocardia sp.]|uniref:M20 metallopeptidase family protein n=1 Tax=Nocardia sp. TaxID=1821 RepID=UPI0026174A81|nr:amidohydrolase [Nocardia sp.]MCU1648376.1 amidohydrolase [Nocardia sp.]